jgi:hypothetical protein
MAGTPVVTGSGGRIGTILREALFGSSDNTWKIYDTPRARAVLGYAPKDDAGRFRGR